MGRIIGRSISGTITPDEQAKFDDWLQIEKNQQIYAAIRNGQPLSETLLAFDGIDVNEGYREFQASIGDKKKGFWFRSWMAVAAAVTVFLTVWATIYLVKQADNQPVELAAGKTHDILPGGNRATLTLADGRTITLDEARSGIIIGSGGITYNDGDPLAVAEGNTKRQVGTALLELSTPKGGTYQITLPDGSQVWLNAASTLKYPGHFGSDERTVELEGEAYFRVKSDRNRLFKVKSNEQYVSVLGTEFNVLAYHDELETQTTLVEGSIEIFNRRSEKVNKLFPGEQGVIRGSAIAVQPVAVDKYIAWKDGRFYFKKTPFEELMRQIARWYDVEIVYNKDIPQETFSGEMSRNLTLKSALELLNVSAVKVKIVGRRLIVN
ncbi:FecR domain-containing protein [Parapedobacter sp. 10938]|nr:FecR domain-containing protein [Parapedobacter sp. 10938]